MTSICHCRESYKGNGEPVPVRQRKISPPVQVPVPASPPFNLALPVASGFEPPTPHRIEGKVIFRVMFKFV